MTLIKLSLNPTSRNHIPLYMYMYNYMYNPQRPSLSPGYSATTKAAEDSRLDTTNSHKVCLWQAKDSILT